MNKLVSKNSVLRFKLGRKIVKALFGFITPLIPRTLLKRNGSFGNGRKDGKWVAGKFIPDKNNVLQKKQQSPKDYSFMKGGTRLRTPEEQKKWEAEVQRLKNLMKNDPRKVINKQRITPRFLSKYANMANTIGGANNIRAWLQKLKNYYAPGTYNPDSIWGANTQAAYERYLAEQNNNINLGLVKLEPVSISSVKESVLQNDFAQDKLNNYPSATTIQSSNPVLNLQNDFASDRQNYYPSVTMSTPSTETVPVLQNDFASQKSSGYQSGLSRGAQLFSNITLRPEFKKYGYWRILNTNPFTIYSKQGSKLVYKNPVKRFKSNFR